MPGKSFKIESFIVTFIKTTVLIMAIPYFSSCASYQPVADLPRLGHLRCGMELGLSGNLCEDEIEFLSRMENDPRVGDPRYTKRETLIEVMEEESYPEAAALFYLTVNHDPRTVKLLERQSSGAFKKRIISKTRMLYIPGMFYDRQDATDGQGEFIRQIARELGMSDEIVQVSPAGSVQENGKTICEQIRNMDNTEKVIVTSISKGGADFKAAINHCGTEPAFHKISGWLNIAGLNRGSFLANFIYDDLSNRIQSRLFFYSNDYDYEGLRSLRVIPDSPLYPDPIIPEHMKTLNVIPVALHRHVTSKTDETFRTLIQYGPNDGYTVSADSYLAGTVNLAVWGVDHFFKMKSERRTRLLQEAFLFLGEPKGSPKK